MALFEMTPFGMAIITIAAAAGLLTWWILAHEKKQGKDR